MEAEEEHEFDDPRLRPLNEAERKALGEMRERCVAEGSDDDARSTDDALLRFLRARELDVDAAVGMWRRWREWREEFGVDRIEPREIRNEIGSGKAFWCGHDVHGHPCLVVRTREHFPKRRKNVEETLRFAVWVVETGVRLAEANGVSQFVVLYDREGMMPANRDRSLMTLAMQLTGMLQDFYAERLYKIYFRHVNFFFWLVYRAASPLLSAHTKSKVVILSDGDAGDKELAKEFAPDQLLRVYGGENDWEYDPSEILGPPVAPGTVLLEKQISGEKIGAGKRFETELRVDVPDQVEHVVVTLSFETKARDVAFEAHFVPDAEDAEDDLIQGSMRFREYSGEYVTAQDGVVHVAFDNKFSYFRSKQVDARLCVCEGVPVEEEEVVVVDEDGGAGALSDEALMEQLAGAEELDESEIEKLKGELGA